MVKDGVPGYDIYIQERVSLNSCDQKAFEYLKVDEKSIKEEKKKKADIDLQIKDFMCRNFYDIRTFGAVMTTFVKAALNCGQVRGPVQLGFARSIDPVVQQEVSITRIAITTDAELEKKGTEMGRKYIIPYALYRAEGFVSANLAQRSTGFSEEDLRLLWDAIINMFENDHSAARGKMAVRELIIFKHDAELGNAPSYKLFDTVTAKREDDSLPARKYVDYQVTVDFNAVPEGVTCTRMID
jgi:CRISPR-associated protein Csd2